MQTPVRRTALALLALVLLTGGLAVATAGSAAATREPVTSAASSGSPVNEPYGAVPMRNRFARMQSRAVGAAMSTATTATTVDPRTLTYGGGVDGAGAITGHSKVYLVFYGSQWGSRTVIDGTSSFTGDPDHAAEAAQRMFRGIGTNGERWSADLTQWCDGPRVAFGATSCPADADFVPYQAGGVLSGVWYDNAAPAPARATNDQLGQEALRAAGHFGNTTAAANRYAYYVVLSAHGTDPGNYQESGHCAWHSYTNDAGSPASYGNVFYGVQPYNTDVGGSCGQGFVNGPDRGTLDGYTMTLGHEWHEAVSDPVSPIGWTNRAAGNYFFQENADECEWIPPGQPGGAADVTFATGTFAEQASWSNDTDECAMSHAIVGNGIDHSLISRRFHDPVVDRCLGIDPDADPASAPATLVACDDGRHLERWAEIRSTYGGNPVRSFRLLRADGREAGCLDIAGEATSNGASVVVAHCSGSTSQLWYTTSTGGVVNRQSRLVLDTAYARTDLGAPVVQGRNRLSAGNPSAAPTQKWSIESAS